MSSYKKAGVDIEAGDRFVKEISTKVKKTFSPAVLFGLGGFGASFSLKKAGVLEMENPILVSSTDGVGTKLKLAILANMAKMAKSHYNIGIDLVAMAVNDISAMGARPLFLLDYMASGKTDAQVLGQVMDGIIEGCLQAECALVGGETAEMPGIYAPGDYDLSACVVGVIEKKELPDPSKVCPGDILVGAASSGFHSNGFSLIRKAIPELALKGKLLEELLRPTKIYHHLATAWAPFVKCMAHITGGGLVENVPRILPEGTKAAIGWKPWKVPWVIQEVLSQSEIPLQEAFGVFNMGIGWVGVFAPEDAKKALKEAHLQGHPAYLIGHVEGSAGVPTAELAPDLTWCK